MSALFPLPPTQMHGDYDKAGAETDVIVGHQCLSPRAIQRPGTR
jgi:hypothetical protein